MGWVDKGSTWLICVSGKVRKEILDRKVEEDGGVGAVGSLIRQVAVDLARVFEG